ncbi:MAG: MFS transporter [Candidatus Korobacteraceae bacterium]
MATPTISILEYGRLVRTNRNFRKLWLAQIVSEIGDWFYTIANFSLLLDLTGRAESVALGLVLWVLPQTFVGPIAGAVNDRISRRRVMIFADLARVVIVGSMLLVRSAQTAWLIYPLIFLETLMAGFFEPARNSVIPNITPERDVIVANTLASTTWSFNLAIGSLIGGVVAATLGRQAVFVINALSFLVSAMFISRMEFDEPRITHQRLTLREVFDYSPMVEGFRYIGQNLRMFAMVSLRGGTGILGAVSGVRPARVADAKSRASGLCDCWHECAAHRAGHRIADWTTDRLAMGRN